MNTTSADVRRFSQVATRSQARTPNILDVALLVLSRLWAIAPFGSVIDVGCGLGAWLFAARQLGARRLVGVDRADVDQSQLLIMPSEFIGTDLNGRFRIDGTFELCLCLEVAQYLHPGRSRSLVDDLTTLSEVVVFAAALPFQAGHADGACLNGAWHEYWARLFKRREYAPWTGLREALWNCRQIPWWYRQDTIVFIKEAVWGCFLPSVQPASLDQLTLVHPEHYVQKAEHRPRVDPTRTQEAAWAIRRYYKLGSL